MHRARTAPAILFLIVLGLAAPLAAQGFGTVAGRVTDEATGQGLAGAFIRITDIHRDTVLAEIYSDAEGRYSASGVAAGQVAVEAQHPGYVDERYDDVPYFVIADPPEVLVSAGQTTAGIDFALSPAGKILVQVVAAETGQPLALPDGAACSVHLLAVPGQDRLPAHMIFGCGGTDTLVTMERLPPGRYYVSVGPVVGRANALHGFGSCNGRGPFDPLCDLAEGTPIEVRAGEDTPVVLALEKGAGLAGRLSFRDRAPGQIPAVKVRVFDEQGKLVAEPPANPDNDFSFAQGGLAPGRYFLTVEGLGVWQSFAWPEVACNRWYCDPLRGEPIEIAAGATAADLDVQLAPIAPYEGCADTATALCLNQGRYRVEATWRDFGGASGAAAAHRLTDETGYFYFFSPDNVEVMVKALDACDTSLGHRFWIFGAGTTNVQVELAVTDTLTGESKLYSNALGEIFQPILDTAGFATCDAQPEASAVADAVTVKAAPLAAPAAGLSDAGLPLAENPGDTCVDNPYPPPYQPTWLCLGGRFQVDVLWTTASFNGYGSRYRITRDTGAFSFFNQENLELMVKVLDACHTPNPGYWVFAAGLTDVEVRLEILDTATGERRNYERPAGGFSPIFDLQAFPCN